MDIMLHAHLPYEKYQDGRYTLMQAAELLCAGNKPARFMWDPRNQYIVNAMICLHEAETWQEGRKRALAEFPAIKKVDWDKKKWRLNKARRKATYGPV